MNARIRKKRHAQYRGHSANQMRRKWLRSLKPGTAFNYVEAHDMAGVSIIADVA
jgi:hypothetical protein